MINTLSMLEHIGSHKIMATQHAPDIDQPTLKHVAEESHHAYFLKRQAEKTAARPMEYVEDDLLAPAAARMYFQRLESAMLAHTRAAAQRARRVPLHVDDRRVSRALVLRPLSANPAPRAACALAEALARRGAKPSRRHRESSRHGGRAQRRAHRGLPRARKSALPAACSPPCSAKSGIGSTNFRRGVRHRWRRQRK